jgi:hypothetical protein
VGLLPAAVPIPADEHDGGQDDRDIKFSIMRPRAPPLHLAAMRTDERVDRNRVQAVVAAVSADHRRVLRSLGEAQRNPGPHPLTIPDFASLHPGYKKPAAFATGFFFHNFVGRVSDPRPQWFNARRWKRNPPPRTPRRITLPSSLVELGSTGVANPPYEKEKTRGFRHGFSFRNVEQSMRQNRQQQ